MICLALPALLFDFISDMLHYTKRKWLRLLDREPWFRLMSAIHSNQDQATAKFSFWEWVKVAKW